MPSVVPFIVDHAYAALLGGNAFRQTGVVHEPGRAGENGENDGNEAGVVMIAVFFHELAIIF